MLAATRILELLAEVESRRVALDKIRISPEPEGAGLIPPLVADSPSAATVSSTAVKSIGSHFRADLLLRESIIYCYSSRSMQFQRAASLMITVHPNIGHR